MIVLQIRLTLVSLFLLLAVANNLAKCKTAKLACRSSSFLANSVNEYKKEFIMAKATTEVITLPTFPVTLVRQLDGHFIHDDISLVDLLTHKSKGLILYFYPKDDTPGCTIQANDFTEHLNAFDDLEYDIIGVSRDSVESHQKFIEKYDLQIALISDSDEKLCQYFDVIQEKNMYGKTTIGLVRSAFVFNKQGVLTHAQRNLRAKDYAERLLETLA